MTQTPYEAAKREASLLKLRAMKLRALGPETDEEIWAVIAAFHGAARKELDALTLLEKPPSETVAGARLEACGLFLEAHDPMNAEAQWQLTSEQHHKSLENTKLPQVLKKQHAALSRALQRLLKNLPSDLRKTAVALSKELLGLLEQYPGVATLWWIKSRMAEAKENWKEVSEALERALALEPERPAFTAAYIFVAPHIFKPQAALEECRLRLEPWREESAEVNLMFGLALLEISRGKKLRGQLLDEIYEALSRAEKLASHTRLASRIRALLFYVADLREGRIPTANVFARAQLPLGFMVSSPEALEGILTQVSSPFYQETAIQQASW